MLLCKKIDLDLEDPRDVYENAVDTIEYLQDIVKSIDTRVLGGEKINGFVLIPGRATRTITSKGYTYLEARLGHDKVFVPTEKQIGITDLEKIIGPEDVAALVTKGYIVYKEGNPKVGLAKKE